MSTAIEPEPDATESVPGPGAPAPIDLRIVVDGASTAGKTTTARSLGERLGRPVHSPEEHVDGRTLLFDWLDHEGGRCDGRPIRTQVVAVPGHLPHLRARLLVTADVIVFVADTTERGIGASAIALEQVRALLEAFEGTPPPMLVQANKRDEPDALPLDRVLERLALGDDDLLIETVATSGEGVRQSYVYAVRLGLQRIRAADGPRVAERQATADDLLRELDRDPRPVRPLPRAGSTSATEGPRAGEPAASPVASPSDDDQRPSSADTQESPLPAPAGRPIATPDRDQPASSHPRAWRRWFDR